MWNAIMVRSAEIGATDIDDVDENGEYLDGVKPEPKKPKTVIKKLYRLISDDVAHGTKISNSMRSQDKEQVFFTPDILQMIESAERTSTIDSVTDRISSQYKREVDVALGMMVKFIEPTALLLAGIFVLWFAIAIFSAIMQIVSLAGN